MDPKNRVVHTAFHHSHTRRIDMTIGGFCEVHRIMSLTSFFQCLTENTIHILKRQFHSVIGLFSALFSLNNVDSTFYVNET